MQMLLWNMLSTIDKGRKLRVELKIFLSMVEVWEEQLLFI